MRAYSASTNCIVHGFVVSAQGRLFDAVTGADISADLTLLPSTGFTDTRGHELFEHDIVKWNGTNWLVKWFDAGGMWVLKNMNTLGEQRVKEEDIEYLGAAIQSSGVFRVGSFYEKQKVIKKGLIAMADSIHRSIKVLSK
jgi:hypothetical protein